MNKTKTPTVQKVPYLLRLPPETYKKLVDEVRKTQDSGNRGFSMNELLTKIIENALKENER